MKSKVFSFLAALTVTMAMQAGKPVTVVKLAREDKNFYYIPLDSATFIGDQLHFDRPTAERLGQGMYNKMIELKLLK